MLQGKSDALFNTALTPAANVEVKDLQINGGENVDIIALGNFLGRAPNSLQLVYHKHVSEFDAKGCINVKTVK